MKTTYQKCLFAAVAIISVCGVIYTIRANPLVPAVGTDMGCPAIIGGIPNVIGTDDDITLTCFQAIAGQTGPTGATGATGAAGTNGTNGTNGSNGAPGVNSFNTPNSRTLSLATAYQATDTSKPAVVNINISSSAAISLTGGTTNTATVVIGSTNAVAGGTGTVICNYGNSNTGTLTIGLNLSTVAASTCSFALPAGWFFAVRQTAGTVTITSAFDQSVG